MIRMLIVLVLLSGCAKNYDFNPWTTMVRYVVKGSYDKNK
jgi:Tfp pilus assembly protein PilP|tara:strand:- start:473 stop:592 length:120 start_codon:yes stop_codon:yes gene_type:complete